LILNKFNIEEVFDVPLYEYDTNQRFNSEDDFLEHIIISEIQTEQYLKIDFDADFYESMYKDVECNTDDPLIHFLQHGYAEGRIASNSHLSDLKKQLDTVSKIHPEIFNTYFYDTDFDTDNYLIVGGRGEYIIHVDVVTSLKKNYPITMSAGSKFFCYFDVFDKNELILSDTFNPSSINQIIGSPHFSAPFYTNNSPLLITFSVLDLVKHYLSEGYKLMLATSKTFSTYSYLLNYSDLRSSAINPLLHFVNHGESENRKACGTFTKNVGRIAFDIHKPTILITAHEASRTGAPIVSLELCKSYHSSHNVVLWLGKDGPLLSHFLEYTCLVHVEFLTNDLISHSFETLVKNYDFSCAIVNSAESYPIAFETAKFDIKTVSLIHEFSEYARPRGRIASLACMSDVVIVPAEIIKKSLLQDVKYLGFTAEMLNVVVKNQGFSGIVSVDNNEDLAILNDLTIKKKELGKIKIVLGCGWVQPRKGVMKFLEVARKIKQIRDDVLFVWVGANYLPETDMGYSVYLDDFVKRSDLQNDLVFINQVENLQPFWDLADLFFMSSLLDPFPNVAIDALVRGIPVLCFEGCTGIAELAVSLPKHVYVADYLESEKASELAQYILELGKVTPEKTVISELFSYEGYRNLLDNEISKLYHVRKPDLPNNIPKWFLNKTHINYIYNQDEKTKVIQKLLTKIPGGSNISKSGDVDFLDFGMGDDECFVIIEPHVEENNTQELFAFLSNLRLKIPNGKYFVLSKALSRNYKVYIESENFYSYQTLMCSNFEQAVKHIKFNFKRRQYKIIEIVYDVAASREIVDEVRSVNNKCISKNKTEEYSCFGLHGFEFWDNLEQKHYCPSVKLSLLR
jgi:glycosyltransferase involved in cell wall biosynthesis